METNVPYRNWFELGLRYLSKIEIVLLLVLLIVLVCSDPCVAILQGLGLPSQRLLGVMLLAVIVLALLGRMPM